jgi:Raf kinase inhibitor-like YbhB/YbcL family protein
MHRDDGRQAVPASPDRTPARAIRRARAGRPALGLVLVGAVAALVLAGCSSSSDPSSSSTSASASPAGSSPAAGSIGSTAPADALVLTSTAFSDAEPIPLRHACVAQGGENLSPPLRWSGVPGDTATLVLVVHDPDAPVPGGFTHLVTTIPTDVTEVEDGASADPSSPMAAWIGPCPPSGEHRYELRLYAFGPDVTLPDGADKAAVDAVAGQALATSVLTGVFAHQGS